MQLRSILHQKMAAIEFTMQDIRLAEKEDTADWMNLMRLVIDGYPVMDEDDYLSKSALICRNFSFHSQGVYGQTDTIGKS